MSFDSRINKHGYPFGAPAAAGSGWVRSVNRLALAFTALVLGFSTPNALCVASSPLHPLPETPRPGSVTAAAAWLARQNQAADSVGAEKRGSITGTAKHAADAPVAGAKITLLGEGTGFRQSVATDGNGRFTFTGLDPGSYAIEAEAAGFQKSVRAHLVVDGRNRVVADLHLVTAGPGTLAASAGGGLASGRPASQAAALGDFNYYDSAPLQPSKVNVPVDPGGYSAARDVDSYSLMLDYLGGEEGGSRSRVERSSPEGPGNNQRHDSIEKSNELQPTLAERGSWSESQFLAHASRMLLNHQVAASVGTFQAGVERFPNSAKLRTGLGIALGAHGEYKQAIASLAQAADLAPSDPRPYFILARIYTASPALDVEVPKRLQRLVSLYPRNPMARYYCALALLKGTGQDAAEQKEAESLLQSALALDPNLADAHLQLGTLYAAGSNYGDAIREYQSALRLKPDLTAAHYRLAQAYARTGKKAAAQAELDSYEHLRSRSSASPR